MSVIKPPGDNDGASNLVWGAVPAGSTAYCKEVALARPIRAENDPSTFHIRPWKVELGKGNMSPEGQTSARKKGLNMPYGSGPMSMSQQRKKAKIGLHADSTNRCFERL